VQADGFVVERSLVRMCRLTDATVGAPAAGHRHICEFAILGPEFA